MHDPHSERMSGSETRAASGLALVFAFRMLGMFMVLPVLATYGMDLAGATPALIGLAIGAYGLTQAIFQIPFGIISDRIGRRPVIYLGLIVFALGSVLAAQSDSIWGVIAGRILQGAGAISAAVTALLADLTREEHRTKVMAMIGSSIGLVFALSLVGAPILYGWIGMTGLFIMTGVLALAAIVLLLKAVPPAPPPHGHEKLPLRRVIRPSGKVDLSCLLGAVLAVGLGGLLRHAAAVVAVVLLMPFVVEPVLGALPQVGARVGPWLPFGNAYTFTKTPWFQTFSLWWGPAGAALYFAAVAAAVFMLALVVVTRRDP